METNNLVGQWVSNFWLWVSLPHATYCIHVQDDKITEAPPIARWCIGCDAREAIERILLIKNSVIIRMKADLDGGEN